MSIQNIILLIAGLINLIMSIIVFSRGIKNKINLYFGLLTFSNFLWAGSLAVFNLARSIEILRLFSSLPYTFSWLVIIFLFYFSLEFPYKTFVLSRLYRWLINIITVIIIIFTTYFYDFFVLNVVKEPEHLGYYRIDFYSMYVILLIFMVFVTIINLIKKYKLAEGIAKSQLGFVIIAVIIGTVFGSYFNLFVAYSRDFRWIHLGPLFTLFINFVAFYYIFSSKKNKKQLV
ncbi:hypothetical protein C4566_00945 [Candidatus Parcubacteria bacterium]|nr:MAG: hypothetical protein C4566_00945 [Candidatus Parcubacteria bacterium]